VQFEITEQTRAAIGAWIGYRHLTGRSHISRRGSTEGLSTDGFRASGLTQSDMARTR
jgi:hypothetical protein